MRSYFLFLPLLLCMHLVSCSEKKSGRTKDTQKDYFTGTEKSYLVEDFTNEMATAETDFLRSLSSHQIKWQKWDAEILVKAEKTQRPIFALLCSPLGNASLAVAQELDENEELREAVTRLPVCTVIDTRVNPEMASLGYHLSSEIKRQTAFPMMVWLSHEGSPIAWTSVGQTSGDELMTIVSNAVAMVEDIWAKSSRYAVENSRRDNENRQRRFIPRTGQLEIPFTRDELFRRETRQLSSLYSYDDKDLDFLGGLLPTNSIELLAIGSRSARLTDEVREQCREAALELARELTSGALKDPLDDSYFYARRTGDWTLPSFAKDLISQAKVAAMLIKVGSLFDEETLTNQGLELLEILESQWLAKGISSQTPKGDPDLAGAYMWDFKTLKNILNEVELKVATTTFSLDPNGNIPLETDPLGKFFELNSLRSKAGIKEIAEKHQLSPEAAAQTVETIKSILLAHRKDQMESAIETTITVRDLAFVLRAQILRANHTGSGAHLDAAKTTAGKILSDYWQAEEGLARINEKGAKVPARAMDAMTVSRSLSKLYQATLDQRWLEMATAIADHALAKFGTEIELLTEVAPEDRVIPIEQYSVAMIFGESTLGISDQALSRLFALTGKDAYQAILKTHFKVVAPEGKATVVNHTDYISSCALGESPLVAVLQGDPGSDAGKQFMATLNEPKYLSFLTFRPESGSALLAPLTGMPAAKGSASVVLTRAGEALGQATTREELTELLDSVISGE